MSNAADLQRYLASAAQHRSLIAIDLSAVRFMDSTGLTALIHTYKLLERSGGSFLLLGPSPEVSRVLTITGLDGLFRICRSVGELERVIPLPSPTRAGSAPTVAAG